MAKIRGIKPEFWTDEDVVELSIPARLLFIGLWNLACDNGHVPDKPKQIKMRLMPADPVDVHKLLDELAARDRLDRTEGTITIHNFAKHQKPHTRWWATCDLPLCNVPEGAQSTPNNRGKGSSHTPSQPLHNGGTPVDNGGATADVDVDGDGDSDGELTRPRKRASQLPETFRPTDKHVELAESHGIDLRREWPKFVNHHRAKGTTFKDWDAGLRTWILKAADYAGTGQRHLQLAPSGEPMIPFAPDDRR